MLGLRVVVERFVAGAQLQVTWCGSPRSPRSLPVPFMEVQSSSCGQKSPRKYFCSTKSIKSLFRGPPSLTFSFTEEFNLRVAWKCSAAALLHLLLCVHTDPD